MTELQKHWKEQREAAIRERDDAILFVLRTLNSRMAIMSPNRAKALEMVQKYNIGVECLFRVALEKSENV